MADYQSILRAFNDKKLRYLIVGGVAVNLHGYPRFTNDIDILLALDHDNLATMASIMKGMGYQQRLPIPIQELENTDNVRTLMKEKGLIAYSFIHAKEPQFNIDVLVAESLDFENFSAQKMNAEVWGLQIPVVSIDDLITMKKNSNREKDHLRRIKYASVESKFNALANMIAFTNEAQESCKKRGAKYRNIFSS